MVKSVLVICTGNVCRSPMGERLLRQVCPGLTVDSAGIYAASGSPADSAAYSVSARNGISLSGHAARRLTPEMVHAYELLLVMEPVHITHMRGIAPWAEGKTMLFGRWSGYMPIPDPYRRGDEAFEHVFILLKLASQQWASRLSV